MQEIENLVIVGSGPAGYTAAIYSARANLSPLVITGFDAGGIPGGQLMTTTYVENFPGFPDGVMGPELMDLIKAQAIRWGTRLLEVDLERVDFSRRPLTLFADNKEIKTNSVIIATGASANRLCLPKEDFFWSRGISACAICDGATPQFRNEDLAVVGGGDSACEEAVYLTKYASQIHLLVRGKTLRASAAMADRVLANKQITVHFETEVIKLQGDKWLEKIQIVSGSDRNKKQINIKGLFYAIGHKPNTEIFANQLDLDKNRYLITQPGRTETSLEGVFAAGDVADSEWRQGITAAGSGCKAALSVERWLSKNNLTKLIKRESLYPEEVAIPQREEISSELNYNPNIDWQIGSYALRRLYHETNKPLLVIYTSPNCGPCHVLKPQLKRVVSELNQQVIAIEINIEEEQEIALRAGVNGTPTVQLFSSKQLIKEWKGVKQRSVFKEAVELVLKK